MPTTLFVLVNAVINAFRLVDHVVVMTRGGPDNATALLLYYIYEIGFRFWDSAYAAALTMVLLALLALVALAQFWFLEQAGALPMSADDATRLVYDGARLRWRRRRRGCSALLWVLPLRLRGLDGVPPGGVLDALRARRAAHARQFRAAPGTRRRSRATSSTPWLLVTMVLAAQLVLVTLAAYAFARFEFPGRDVAVRAGAGAADGDARRADRRELPDDGARWA